jgi:LacI family transcriptional regulator
VADRSTGPDGGRVRLVDVATLAGVTKSVVSRVLNDDPSLLVRPETRQRVLNAAQRLGYRPHAGARALAGAEARALALLIPDLSNPVYSRIIRGAYQRARDHGYVVLLAEDTADHEADESFAELVEAGRVDGLLIASARPGHKLLESGRLSRVPYVFVNREVPGSDRNVGMDLAAASATAVDHLYELGHRRIGHVSGPAQLEPARRREDGFKHRMAQHGLEADRIEHDEFSELGGARATERLLELHPDVTAVYASTLSQAVGVLHVLDTRGLSVPGDVSVITYDDLPLAGFLHPPLTTVAMPLIELGATAVDAVVAQIAGHPPCPVTVDTRPDIVVRRSTAPPGR